VIALAVLGVLRGELWRFQECYGKSFGGLRNVRGSVLEILGVLEKVFWRF